MWTERQRNWRRADSSWFALTQPDLLAQPNWLTQPNSRGIERGEWRRIWLAIQSKPWRALAVVAGDDSIPTHDIATHLMKVGQRFGEPTFVADLRGAPYYAAAFLDVVAYHVSRGDRVVLPTGTVRDERSVLIARGADCAIFCARLGSTPIQA